MSQDQSKILARLDRIAFGVRRGLVSSVLTLQRGRNWLARKTGLGKCFYAEFFTDRYIRNQFFPDYDYQGCIVEVGCATPQLLSMSQHFRESGWRCVGIEPNPQFVALHQDAGNEVLQYAAADFTADEHDFVVVEDSADYSDQRLSAHSYSALHIKPEFAEYKNGALKNFSQTTIKVRVRPLNDILRVHCPDLSVVDVLAVDVEGFEIEVMKGFTPGQYGTKVIVLENLFHDVAYNQYMAGIDYKLHCKLGHNYIYVRR